MRFDFCIGNPPYQEDVQSKGDRANPVYDKFMDAAYEIGEVVELIHPARFLFEAGQTPKAWNRKMLDDVHFSVLHYEPDSSKVFPNVEIKGGVAISIHDTATDYGAIGTFTAFPELNTIVRKVRYINNENKFLDTIIASQGLYRFTDAFFKEYPDASRVMGAGTGNKIVSSVVEKLPNVFLENVDDEREYVKLLCRIRAKRAYRFILRRYIANNDYIATYNLFIPEANNTGEFGETLTEPTVGYPGEGSTDTYLSAGTFLTELEPKNLARYMRTKFFRGLLGVRKVTQHCPPPVWRMIPLQDFTSASDIDWAQPIPAIDQQLYRKYGLTKDEIAFIESHVKEMI